MSKFDNLREDAALVVADIQKLATSTQQTHLVVVLAMMVWLLMTLEKDLEELPCVVPSTIRELLRSLGASIKMLVDNAERLKAAERARLQ